MHNQEKSTFAERFIRNFKHKVFKYMTSISVNKDIDKLDDINWMTKNTTIQIIELLNRHLLMENQKIKI